MGVDCSIFNNRTRTRCDIDREDNLNFYPWDEKYDDILDSMFDGTAKVKEVKLYFNKLNLNNIRIANIIKWLEILKDDDIVFVMRDNDDEYYDNSFCLYLINLKRNYYEYYYNDILKYNIEIRDDGSAWAKSTISTEHIISDGILYLLAEWRERQIDKILE